MLTFMQALYAGGICWFCGGRKTKALGEKPSEQDDNQQQTHLTHGTATKYNPDHFRGRRALLPQHPPC